MMSLSQLQSDDFAARGGAVVKWLALLPDSEKVMGLVPGLA